MKVITCEGTIFSIAMSIRDELAMVTSASLKSEFCLQDVDSSLQQVNSIEAQSLELVETSCGGQETTLYVTHCKNIESANDDLVLNGESENGAASCFETQILNDNSISYSETVDSSCFEIEFLDSSPVTEPENAVSSCVETYTAEPGNVFDSCETQILTDSENEVTHFEIENIVSHVTDVDIFSGTSVPMLYPSKEDNALNLDTSDTESDYLKHVMGHNDSDSTVGNVFHNQGQQVKRYTCDMCPYSFNLFFELCQHKKSHTVDTFYVCYLCQAWYQYFLDLKSHLASHTVDTKFPSEVCNSNSISPNNIQTFETCDNEDDTSTMAKGTLKSNLIDKHCSVEIVPCSLDKDNERQKLKLLNGYQWGGDEPFIFETLGEIEEMENCETINNEAKLLSCRICQYLCRSAKHLEEHVRKHYVRNIICCNLCSYTCKSKSWLITHKKKMHNTKDKRKTVRCDLCDYTCKSASWLITHKKRTHRSKNKLVPTCPPTRTKARSKKRVRKSFSCNLCNYRCESMAWLKRHKKTHRSKSKKLLSCDICNFTCRFQSELTKHKTKHTGREPFSCNLSDDSTAVGPHHGKRHRKTREGKKSLCCIRCDFTCTQLNQLKIHARTHAVEEPYSCDHSDSSHEHLGPLEKHRRLPAGGVNPQSQQLQKTTMADNCKPNIGAVRNDNLKLEVFDDLEGAACSDSECEDTVLSDDAEDLEFGNKDFKTKDKKGDNGAERQTSGYVSSDGTVWSKKADTFTTNSARNVYSGCPMGSPHSSIGKLSHPLGAANLILTDTILEQIIQFTNEHGVAHCKKVGHADSWVDMDIIELRALIGLWLIAGTLQRNTSSLSDLWDAKYGVDAVQSVMSFDRFSTLMRHLRFDSSVNRKAKTKRDKLAPVRNIMEQITQNWSQNYSPGPSLTVGNQYVEFSGKCPFKVIMPNTTDKFGMKFFLCCDSQTNYPLHAVPFCGKYHASPVHRTGHKKSSRKLSPCSKHVFDVVSKYFGTGRNITTDTHFTSLELAQLLSTKNLTLVGHCHPKKAFVPKKFRSHQQAVGSCTLGFIPNTTLLSYRAKPTKNVVILSTRLSAGGSGKDKPEIIRFYENTKGGVSGMDSLVKQFMCAKNDLWPVAFFMNLVDISMAAAYIIWMFKPTWRISETDISTRKLFLRAVGEALVAPQAERRAWATTKDQISEDIKKAVLAASSTKEEPPAKLRKGDGKRRRCYCCPATIDHKYKVVCSKCGKHVCKTHSELVCVICQNRLPEKPL